MDSMSINSCALLLIHYIYFLPDKAQSFKKKNEKKNHMIKKTLTHDLFIT